jgi:hypothetical protein
MYGYQPPSPEPEGSWREVFLIIKVVFQMLAPLVGVITAVLVLGLASLMLLFWHPLLALIPAGAIGGGITWLVRRDRHVQAEEERRIFGP